MRELVDWLLVGTRFDVVVASTMTIAIYARQVPADTLQIPEEQSLLAH